MINNVMITHKHHIVPKHAGGTDDASNLIELTVEEHAEAHRKLFEQHEHLQDKLAWLGLRGLISTAEIVHTLQSEGMKGSKNPMYGKPAPNRGVKRPGIGGRKKGTTWSAAEREMQQSLRDTKSFKSKMAAVYSDPDRNGKISKNSKGKVGAARGKKWYNNGKEESYFINAPPGWHAGRLAKIDK
jgi:hypothetical protein